MDPRIDVRPQIRLGTARTFGLCLKGIRHRLFRSILTTTVIILAVAFFMNLLADSVIARAVDAGVRSEVREIRRPAVAIDAWFGHPGAAVLAGRIIAADAPLAAYAAVAGWSADDLAGLAAACRRERQLLTWLDAMDGGTRAMLVRRARDDEVLAWLGDEARWRDFAALAVKVRSPVLPMPIAEVRAAVDAAQATSDRLARYTAAWNAAVDAVAADLVALTGAADRDGWVGWISSDEGGRAASFAKVLAARGFGGLWSEPSVGGIVPGLRLLRLRDAVTAALLSDDGRKRWLEAFRDQPSLEDKLARVGDRRAVEVLGGAFTAEELDRVATAYRTERRLAARETALAGKVDPDGGLVSTRQGFLVAISFIVCMVGIANAMLMAITERFREIATMKCLGATDGFILTQFLMEAGIQGAAGGAMGTVVGLALSLAKGGWLYGGHLAWCFPWLGIAATALACIVAGLVLATLASVYPSWMASRMAPMEAMRVE